MTELELWQKAGWGDARCGQPSSQKILDALADFLRSLEYHRAAELCDVLAKREDYFDEH